MFTYTDSELAVLLDEAGAWETGVSMHAIGELAIEQALNALEGAMKRGYRFSPMRLEHVQLISAAQADRAKKLGATLSMQPNFTSDSHDYADRLAASYLEGNNPFRMLIDDAGFKPGTDLIFGSDGMPDGIAYAATQSLFPVFPSQGLTLDELVAGYGPARGVSGAVALNIDETARRVTVESVTLQPDPAPRTR